MGRKQQSGFGVVARTGVSLLALGFGSALFGAMVVGPGLGGLLNREDVSAENRRPAAETRLASADLSGEDSQPLRETAEPAPEPSATETPDVSEAPPAVPEEETENPDLIRYADGTSASTGIPPEALSGAGAPAQPEAVDLHRTRPAEPPAPDDSMPEPASRVKESRREPEATPAPRRTAEPKSERVSEPEKAPVRVRKPEPTEPSVTESRRPRAERKPDRSERTVEAAKVEPEKRKPERAERIVERPKSEPEKRAPERRERGASAKVETDKRKPERVESNKPFAPREIAASDAPAPEGKLYRVRVGRVTSREDAEKLRDELRDNVGIDAFLVKSGEGFRVQTGAYRARVNAEKIAAELRAGSFRPEVTED